MHVVNTNKAHIGEGVFLIKDVANILDLPYPRVRLWIKEWDKNLGKDVGGYSIGNDKNKAVNFYTLIEFYTFYKLREAGFSSQKIKKIHRIVAKETDTKYPFASKIRHDGKHIWYEHPSIEGMIKADGRKQFTLKKILIPYLQKIKFGKDGLAEYYYPIGNNRKIVVHPKHQFGQPTIEGTNIKAETIYSYIRGGETKESVCYLYNLTPDQVTDTIKYCKKIAA